MDFYKDAILKKKEKIEFYMTDSTQNNKINLMIYKIKFDYFKIDKDLKSKFYFLCLLLKKMNLMIMRNNMEDFISFIEECDMDMIMYEKNWFMFLKMVSFFSVFKRLDFTNLGNVIMPSDEIDEINIFTNDNNHMAVDISLFIKKILNEESITIYVNNILECGKKGTGVYFTLMIPKKIGEVLQLIGKGALEISRDRESMKEILRDFANEIGLPEPGPEFDIDSLKENVSHYSDNLNISIPESYLSAFFKVYEDYFVLSLEFIEMLYTKDDYSMVEINKYYFIRYLDRLEQISKSIRDICFIAGEVTGEHVEAWFFLKMSFGIYLDNFLMVMSRKISKEDINLYDSIKPVFINFFSELALQRQENLYMNVFSYLINKKNDIKSTNLTVLLLYIIQAVYDRGDNISPEETEIIKRSLSNDQKTIQEMFMDLLFH